MVTESYRMVWLCGASVTMGILFKKINLAGQKLGILLEKDYISPFYLKLNYIKRIFIQDI